MIREPNRPAPELAFGSIRRAFEHIRWADERVYRSPAEASRVHDSGGGGTGAGVAGAGAAGPGAADAGVASTPQHRARASARTLRPLGTEERWLSRLVGSEPESEVWPEADLAVCEALRERLEQRWNEYLSSLTGDPARLRAPVDYVNSAGVAYTDRVEDILFHVYLHGAYHRVQVALLLRAGGFEPAPGDYIAFVRGGAAATRADANRSTTGGETP